MRTKDLLQEIILFATVVIGLFISISLASPALDYLLGVDLFLEYRTEGNMHIIQSNNKYALITGILIASIGMFYLEVLASLKISNYQL